jgi:hypothetical protein
VFRLLPAEHVRENRAYYQQRILHWLISRTPYATTAAVRPPERQGHRNGGYARYCIRTSENGVTTNIGE